MQGKTLVLTVIATAVLAGCGGGGGGGSSTLAPFVRTSVPYATPTRAADFQPLVGSGISATVTDIFARDLNQDNVDEVVIGGRKSQPTSTLQDYNLQIYGWNTGSFAKETATWFSGTDNRIAGTEPAIRFGDFNGDGNVDMLVAPGTDSATTGPAQVFFNTGSSSFTRSDIAVNNVWGHDATVADLNGDGRDDFIIASLNSNSMVIAFGNANGTFTTYQPSVGTPGAAGVSVADYLGNGTKTIVLTDSSATGNSDTKLYSWDVSTGSIVLTELAVLPASRFYLAKWDSARAATAIDPHEIRNISTDFNGDGRPDIIVVSTLPSGQDNPYTEVQFLRNNGGGNFTDVTDTVLVGFNNNTAPSYQPQLIDVNRDGLLDIFLGAGDYVTDRSAYDSSRVLIATSDGKYVEQYASVFRDFWNQISTSTAGATQQGFPVNIVRGPNNDMYLVGTVDWTDNGTTKTAVYASRITSSGVVTAQSTAAALSAQWPYLTGVELNETLARTSTSLVDGIPVVDWQQAFQPVGGLGISLSGRQGERSAITGMLAFPNMKTNLFSSVSAVDALGRDYSVNMSGMTNGSAPNLMGQTSAPSNTMPNIWSMRWSQFDFNKPLQAQGDNRNFAITARVTPINSRYQVQTTVVKTPTNPWLMLSGVFGSVEASTTSDITVSRSWKSGWWASTGWMRTTTELQPGIVTKVSDIHSVYATAGWQNKQWSTWVGTTPYIVSGSVELKIPKYVDTQGTMHYNNHTVGMRNPLTLVAGVTRNWQVGKHTDFATSVETTSTGFWKSSIRYQVRF